MAKLFGTDGIRGIANQEPITAEMGLKVGRAVVHCCKGRTRRPRIVIGRDTRLSGKMLEFALVSGILSIGAGAIVVGELPTPGVAFITREVGADAGIMISASHNPYEYNGFKVFSGDGYKLSDEDESRIENLIIEDIKPTLHGEGMELGRAQGLDEASERYISFLRGTLPERYTFDDMKVVLDCANGATYKVAPAVFHQLGARVESLFVEPDGKNINLHCGSQHPDGLSEKVRETGADVGLAFDGDGDRLIAVDEKGSVLTGDQILLIFARMLKDKGALTHNIVVSTVMSNMGFRIALKDMGVEHVASKVGDRYVLEKMKERKAILGGEDSGHIIFLHRQTTGDGILCALQLVSAMKMYGKPLSNLSGWMTRYPQSLINAAVKDKPEISSVPEVAEIIQSVEASLGEKGRVLVRYSGTEPLCRIMVEGEKQEEIDAYARQIAGVISRRLG